MSEIASHRLESWLTMNGYAIAGFVLLLAASGLVICALVKRRNRLVSGLCGCAGGFVAGAGMIVMAYGAHLQGNPESLPLPVLYIGGVFLMVLCAAMAAVTWVSRMSRSEVNRAITPKSH